MHCTSALCTRLDPQSDSMDLADRVPQRRRWKKQKTATAAATTTAAPSATLPDDVVLDILGRLADDLALAALFRCATACKRWRDLVSDPSFLRGRSPDPSSSSLLLLGFFAQNRPYRARTVSPDPLPGARSPAFVPAPRSPLGPGRRSLASFLPCSLDLDDAEPLAARQGLLLVRLAPPRYGGAPAAEDVGAGRTLVHLAVCNLHAGTCEVLPPLKCWTSSSINSCAILTDADSCTCSHGRSPSPLFPSHAPAALSKVHVIVFNRASQHYYLCTFSSAESSWSTPPAKCFVNPGFAVVTDGGAVVWEGGPCWLVRAGQQFYILGVWGGHVLFEEIRVPPDPDDDDAGHRRLLSVAGDGKLRMILLDVWCQWLEIWTLDEDSGGDVGLDWNWILTKEVELNELEPERSRIKYLGAGETLLVMDEAEGVYVADLGAGAIEEVTEEFRRINVRTAVPVEMDWLAFFLTRLEGTRHGLKITHDNS